MANYNITERNCAAGVESVSPSITVPDNLTVVKITLVSSQWASKAGTGTLVWGLARSLDNGATWQRWLQNPADGDTLTIGALFGKGHNLMPAMEFWASDLVSLAGTRVRLFAVPSVTIRLGATVETTRQ